MIAGAVRGKAFDYLSSKLTRLPATILFWKFSVCLEIKCFTRTMGMMPEWGVAIQMIEKSVNFSNE